MKKILVISDSHNILKTLNSVLKKINKKIDIVIHLGDLVSDTDFPKEMYPSIIFYNVVGNCDFYSNYPEENTIEIYDRKIFFSHGHNFGVKNGYERIYYSAKERSADVCLFGHSHQWALFKEDNVFFMNPGSISLPRGTNHRTYGIINIYENSNIEFSIVNADKIGGKILAYL